MHNYGKFFWYYLIKFYFDGKVVATVNNDKQWYRVTSYQLFLLHELRVTFYIRITSYCLLHELRVTLIVRVTSYRLLHELRVNVYYKSYEALFNYELQ